MAMGVRFQDGAVHFRVDHRPDDPSGRQHVPKILSGDLRLDPNRVRGFRVHYKATGCTRQTNDRAHAYPYMELHWEALNAKSSHTFVSLPVIADGQERAVDAILSRDPVWRTGGRVKRVGLWPLNDAGEFTLLRVEIIEYADP